jgi:hypothetical protein
VRGPKARAQNVAGADLAVIQQGLSLAKTFTGIAAENIQQRDTTEAEDGINKFERAKNELFFAPESGYFNTQGKSAYDTAEDANTSLQTLAKTYAAGMSNPTSRQMFMDVANRHITSGQSDIMRHSSKGLKAWEVTTIKAQTENTLENAALFRGDSKRLSVQRELGRQSIHESAKLEGVTGVALNEQLQTYDSAFASATIDASILDNAEKGKDSLDKYGSMLEGAEKQKFEEKIRKKQDLEKTQLQSQQAVASATVIVNANDGDRSAVLKEISKLPIEEQPGARKEAMYQVNQLETAKVETRNGIYDDATKFVADNGSSESYKAAYPERWDKLSTKQQRQLEKGEPVVNDWNTWLDVMSKSDAEISKMNPSEVDKTAAKLDDSHRDKFMTMWKNTRNGKASRPDSQVGRTRSAQTTSAVIQLMGKKKSKWSTNDLARSDQFYALVDGEHESRKDALKRELTSEEYTNMLDSITNKVTIERSFWFDKDVGIGDIPEEHLGVLTNALRKRNIPVTSDNLVRAYEQAR